MAGRRLLSTAVSLEANSTSTAWSVRAAVLSFIRGVPQEQYAEAVVQINALKTKYDKTNASLTASVANVEKLKNDNRTMQARIASIQSSADQASIASTAQLKSAKDMLSAIKRDNDRQTEEISQLRNALESTSQNKTHPTYGTLIQDFGYKRVFSIMPDQIADSSVFPVWKKQRVFRKNRAEEIAKSMVKSNFKFPGVISVFETPHERSIVDGQHRVGALRILRKRHLWPADKEILIEVHHGNDDSEVAQLFHDINKAEPVLLVDMPDATSDVIKRLLHDATAILKEKYPAMFSESSRCRMPHVNIDRLRDEIFRSGIIERYEIDSSEKLLKWIETANQQAIARSTHAYKDRLQNPTFNKAFSKAQVHKFFLGIDKTWLQ